MRRRFNRHQSPRVDNRMNQLIAIIVLSGMLVFVVLFKDSMAHNISALMGDVTSDTSDLDLKRGAPQP